MRYCEMESQGPVSGFCDQRASIKIEGGWYCQHHADALREAREQWSGVNWFPLSRKGIEEQKPRDRHDYGSLFDDEDEDQPSI